MRMRKKKHGAERIAVCSDYFIHVPTQINDLPIELEIGCGKGSFIFGMAEKYPERNFIALEKISDVILIAAERIKNNDIKNVKFIIGDAKNLTEYFPASSVSRIYLNFSDPWPKKGHTKRRLTYKDFLNVYKSILIPGGEIVLKTDNVGLFDYSIESLTENGFEVHDITRDLHSSQYNEDNVVTEYEKNFSEKGIPINRLVATLC